MAQNMNYKNKNVNIMGDVASYVVLVSFVALSSPRVALQHPEFSSPQHSSNFSKHFSPSRSLYLVPIGTHSCIWQAQAI